MAEVPKSTSSRGLCNICDQYNWKYHLMRSSRTIDNSHPLFDEKVAVDAALEETPTRPIYYTRHNYPVDYRPLLWHKVLSPSHQGSYYVDTYGLDEGLIYTHFKLGSFGHHMDHRHQCSLCELIYDLWYITGIDRNVTICCDTAEPVPTKYESLVLRLLVVRGGPELGRAGVESQREFTILSSEAPYSRILSDSSRIDFQLVKAWWQNCLAETIQEVKDVPLEQAETAYTFRVIDVTENKVITAPQDCRYFCLSYVWGSVELPRLTRADSAVNSNHGFHKAFIRARLPQTIRDAMFIVELLGERYLWTDCLCITQDDLEELESAISSMHQVYSHGLLTIIAAEGSHADHGIEALPHSPQYRSPDSHGIVDGIGLVTTQVPPTFALSAWAQRGWTYQEHQFSKRCLIFLHRRVYYECDHGVYAETHGTQKLQITGDHHNSRRIQGPSPQSALSRQELFKLYASYVRGYTIRHLSYEDDVLRAFSAVLEHLSTTYGLKFCFGLPTNMFCDALYWSYTWYTRGIDNKPRRRRSSTIGRNVPLPSWSWCGWIRAEYGEVEFPYRGVDRSKAIESDIVWPWDDGYDVHPSSDVFQSGILTVRAEIVEWPCDAMDELLQKTDRFNFLADMDTSCPTITLIRIGKNTMSGSTNVFLLLAQEHSGIFYRIGPHFVSEDWWERQTRRTAIVKLG